MRLFPLSPLTITPLSSTITLVPLGTTFLHAPLISHELLSLLGESIEK